MPPDKPSLTITRWIDASPAKVFAALTDPSKIVRWWGPDAGPTLSAQADVRPGGRFSVTFRTEDGIEHTSYGVYREVSQQRQAGVHLALAGRAGARVPGHGTVRRP